MDYETLSIGFENGSLIFLLLLFMWMFGRGVLMRLTQKELYCYLSLMAVIAFLVLLISERWLFAALMGMAFLLAPFVASLIVHFVSKVVWAKVRRQFDLPNDTPMP
jgi:hypothetical protein